MKRAYSISNGALCVLSLTGMTVGYENFLYISYYMKIHGWYNSDYVQSGQLKDRSSSGYCKRQQDSGTHRSRKG